MRASDKKRLDRMDAELAALKRKANGTAPEHTKVLGFAPVAQNDEQHPDLYTYKGEVYTDLQLSALPVKRLIIITKAYGPLDHGDLDDDQE